MMKNVLYTILVFFPLEGCIEPFEADTIGLESALVVDARLTDEVKNHQIFLSRARPFDVDNIVPERGATVTILENSGSSYVFEEMSPGHYVSTVDFGAKTDQIYQLKITTSDGGSYSSKEERMPENVAISNFEIKRITNDFGEDGVAIVLDNSSLGDQPRYFRYDYEEAYKIVAPKWDPFEFDIIDSIACTDGDAFEVDIKLKTVEDRICFGQKSSTDIILASTDNLDGNTISNFRVRFISRENYILTHRYSILVNQYTQSVDAHSYYQGLQSFSTSESVFSEVQPGFLSGNIYSESDSEEKVIGYFETASVSSQRAFFNYEDLFPEEALPEYPINCATLGNPLLIPQQYHCTEPFGGVCDGNCESPLISQIQANLLVFAAEKEPADLVAPFLTLPVACGDCTVLGSNIKPDFWID